jgi:hypothetical protein
MPYSDFLAWMKNLDEYLNTQKRTDDFFDFSSSAVAEPADLLHELFKGDEFQRWLTTSRNGGRFDEPGSWIHPRLKSAILEKHRIHDDNIDVLATAGASLAMFLVCRALLKCGDTVVIERPTYQPFCAAVHAVGAQMKFLPRKPPAYEIDLEQLQQTLSHGRGRVRLIILSNLYNPGGTLLDKDTLSHLAEVASKFKTWVVFDEVFRDLAPDTTELQRGNLSLLPVPAAYFDRRFISISSLSKAYGLSVLRCGWVLGDRRAINIIRTTQMAVESIGSRLTQALASLVLEQIEDHRDRSLKLLRRNRKTVQATFQSLLDDDLVAGIVPEFGTIYFPRIRAFADVDGFVKSLGSKRRVFVVPGRFFGSPRHIRIGFGSFLNAREISKGLEILCEGVRTFASINTA